jgi:hypothetical protein
MIAGLLVVAACASSGTPTADVGNPGGGDMNANVRNVEISGGQSFPGSVELSADAQSHTPAVWHPVAASPMQTWAYLPIAYSKLGLAITRYDSVTHIIEGERLRSRAPFGGKPLTGMLNCGEVAGMPNVTRFEVNIMVRTGLRGSGNQSSVASVVTATSKPDAVSGVLMPCTVSAEPATLIAAALNEAIKATR